MAVTQIHLDDEALAQVMRITGVRTKQDAVNWALREAVERERRSAAWAAFRGSVSDWDYEGWKEARAQEKADGNTSSGS